MLDACSHFSLSIGEYSKNAIFLVQLGHADNKKYIYYTKNVNHLSVTNALMY